MLIAILMSLNIVSVGYATWAITGPSTSEAGGSFDSYPVIKSDEYVQLTGIEASFIDFNNYTIVDDVTQSEFPQGTFVNVSNGELVDMKGDGLLDQSATVTLTYTVKEAIDNMTIETELLFGKNNADAENSKSFFGTAVPEITSVSGANGKNLTDTDKDGVYLLTLSNVPANTTSIKVVITLRIELTGTFGDSLVEGNNYRFFADTVVKGDLQ